MLPALLFLAMMHPNSISSARIELGPGRVTAELRFEARTANEVVPLDADGDGRLSADEVAAAESTLGAYLTTHFDLTAGGAQPTEGHALTATLSRLTLDPNSLGEELGSTWLLAQLTYTGPLADTLWVDCSLFLETSPDHRNFARFQGPPVADWVFSAADPLWLVDLPAASGSTTQPALAPWLQLGFEHILDGPDHLAFVLGLLLAAGTLRQLALSITGFTLAHSITLSLAALELVPAGGRWAEVAIALSIVYVGAANLRAREPRRAWPEAFGFGLVHGLGFAAALSGALGGLGSETSPVLPLLGFNLGIELGQATAALLGVLLLALLAKLLGGREHLVRLASLLVLLSGLGWLGLRLFA
jgi:hypothetical protein